MDKPLTPDDRAELEAAQAIPPDAADEDGLEAPGAGEASEDVDAIEVIAADQTPTLRQLHDALAAADDRALRAQAELDNFRKRAVRQMEEERKYAPLPLLRDMLSVVDNLQRAIQAAEKSHDGEALFEGVKLVAQQLSTVLQQHNCTPIEAKGQTFDPHVHEAISHMPSQEYPQGSVVEVTQAGYRLHDRVVRPTQVLVSAGPPGPDGGGQGDEAGLE